MILADKIIELRKRSGWSQEELAHQLGVSRQAVSKWESAASIPDLDKILKLSQVFGVSTDYLLKDEIEQEPAMDVADNMEDEEEQIRKLSLEESIEFLEVKEEQARRIAPAIAALILSPELLIFLGGLQECGVVQLSENAAAGIGIIALLCIIGCAVAVMILSAMKTEKYEFMEKEAIRLEYGVEGIVQKKKDGFEATYRTGIAIGVVLCILCVIPLFVGVVFEATDMVMVLCVNLLLALVAAAVYLFVRVGTKWESYQILLQEGDYSLKKKQERRKMSPIAGIYWGIIVFLYLGSSLFTGAWDRTWIIWPCAGVLYGVLCGIVSLMGKKRRE